VLEATEKTIQLPFAHIIGYKDHDEEINGNFILAFETNDVALNLASAIAERLGMGRFEEVCEDSTDLLNEFLNVVVGRTISGWDNIGLSVRFDTPVFEKDHKNDTSKNSKAYLIVMELLSESDEPGEKASIDKFVLRVDISKKSASKIEDKRILLVEDSRVMRKAIANILEKEGVIVEEAQDGEEAIEIHKTFNPDLTLMDINMPKMNGLESITRIRIFRPDSKFMILSSSSRKDEIVKAITLNTSGYLVKPVDPKELVSRVSDVLTG